MKKIIQLDEMFPTGEQTVQPVLLWGQGRQDTSRITKTASEALDYIKHVTPEPGKTNLLLLALGSEEAYGPNRNGDGFPEAPVAAKNGQSGHWIGPDETLVKHYQSFEKNPAHAFKHHQNRDTSKASGVVKKAFWNNKMRRVELLVTLDNEKDPEWVERVNDGEFPPVSMGCRIKRDICSICGNAAATRAHYCFTPDTRVTMADGSQRPIAQIVVGDRVLSAAGNPTTVVATMQQNVAECLVELRSSLSRAPTRVTQNHPIFSAPREAYACYYRATSPGVRSCFAGSLPHCVDCRRIEPTAQETPAGMLRAGDSLYAPPLLGDASSVMSPEDAYVVGLFMAEGSYAKQKGRRTSVQFALHEDEVHLVAAIDTYARRRGRTAKVYQGRATKGVSVRIHSKDIADAMFTYCGEYAAQKKAAPFIINLPDGVLCEYIRGLWDGDGHVSDTVDGYSRLNTTSEDLAWQTAGLLRRLKHTVYVGQAVSPGGPSDRAKPSPQWYVATDYGFQTPRKFSAWAGQRQLGYVKDVTHVMYQGPVHNFTTEAHTYIANGIAVHNCDHAKFQMNNVLPDGRKVYVHNPSPNFFDISRVIRPADRTGYTLKKVASVYELRSSAEMGEAVDAMARKSAMIRKLSDIEKIIRGEPVASSSNLAPQEQTLIKNFRDYAEPRVADSPNLPMDTLLKHSAETVFSTLASMGVMLKDAEFIEFMGSKLAGRRLHLNQATLQKTAAVLPYVYQLFETSPSLCDDVLASGAIDTSVEKVSAVLLADLAPYRTKRAYAGEMLYRRLVPEGVGMRQDGAPTTDMLSWTDPATGQTHKTTRGAAIDAQDAVTKAHATKVLGGTALALGGYKALTAFPALRGMKAPVALGMGALAYKATKPRYGEEITTNEGLKIHDTTEFAPKHAAENIPGLVVNQLEGYRSAVPSSPRIDAILHRLKTAGVDDTVRGLVLDLDEVASAIGELICI